MILTVALVMRFSLCTLYFICKGSAYPYPLIYLMHDVATLLHLIATAPFMAIIVTSNILKSNFVLLTAHARISESPLAFTSTK